MPFILCVCVVEVDQPPASSVRRFLALLEQSDIDFSEELGEICIHSHVEVNNWLDYWCLH